MRNSRSAALHDAAGCARISRVLSGALRIWGVAGTVTYALGDATEFVIAPATGPEVRLSHRVPDGWDVTLRDPVSGAQMPLGSHAGLPGLLRRMREQLAPAAPSGRLVIGAQQLLAHTSGKP